MFSIIAFVIVTFGLVKVLPSSSERRETRHMRETVSAVLTSRSL